MDTEDNCRRLADALASNVELCAVDRSAATDAPLPPEVTELRLPLVSVIVTAHNYARYVGECLASIRLQSYRKFECIVVDDASSDGTPEVAASLLDRWHDGRFCVVSTPRNLGQLGAQMFGLARSRGEFVCLIDADDLLHDDFLERHLFAHLNIETSVAFTSSDQWTIDSAGTVLSFHHSDLISRLLSGEGQNVTVGEQCRRPMRAIMFHWRLTHIAYGEWLWATQSTMMFRRSVLQMIVPDRIAPGVFRICSDYYLVRFAQLLGGSLVLCEALGRYRRHGSNNFSTNPLIASRMQTGDLRSHPTDAEFHDLAIKTIAERHEQFVAVLGSGRLAQLTDAIRKGAKVRSVIGVPVPTWLHGGKLHRMVRSSLIAGIGASRFARIRSRVARI